jgi:hypothetical protein
MNNRTQHSRTYSHPVETCGASKNAGLSSGKIQGGADSESNVATKRVINTDRHSDSWADAYWGPFSRPNERNEHFSRSWTAATDINRTELPDATTMESNARLQKRLALAPFCSDSDTRTDRNSSASTDAKTALLSPGSKVSNVDKSSDSWADAYWGPFSRPNERNEHFSRSWTAATDINRTELPDATTMESNARSQKRLALAPFCSDSDTRTDRNSSASTDAKSALLSPGSKVSNVDKSSDSWKKMILTPFSNSQGHDIVGKVTNDAASVENDLCVQMLMNLWIELMVQIF